MTTKRGVGIRPPDHLWVLFDGTGAGRDSDTAIGRIADALERAGERFLYTPGPGIGSHPLTGRLFGVSSVERVRKAQRQVDQLDDRPALSVLGFSRGGYEALLFAEKMPRVEYIGLFDPVNFTGHHRPRLTGPLTVRSALARDEIRAPYWPVAYRLGDALVGENVDIWQRWYAGNHSQIGGVAAGDSIAWVVEGSGRFPWSVEGPGRGVPRSVRIEERLLPHRRRGKLSGKLIGERG